MLIVDEHRFTEMVYLFIYLFIIFFCSDRCLIFEGK